MKHKIHIASIVVPLAANESIEIDIPDSVKAVEEEVDVAVSRYNQGQVEVIFTEQYAIVDMDEITETSLHCDSCTIVQDGTIGEGPGFTHMDLGDDI